MNMRKLLYVTMPIVLFIVIAVCVQTEAITHFEARIYSSVAKCMSPALTLLMKRITHIGDSATIIMICLVLLAIPKTRAAVGLPVSIAMISSSVLNSALKHTFARIRPDILQLISATGYSFPSGHGMNNAALYTMLILLICRYIKNAPAKIALSLICATLAVLIGFSRVYLGVHYAGDVIGGWLLGLSISLFIYFLWEKRLNN